MEEFLLIPKEEYLSFRNEVRELKEIVNDLQLSQLKENLSLKEASALTGIAQATLYNLKSLKEIPETVWYKSGSRLIFKRTELLDWLRNRNSQIVNYKD